jgi:hypothetical protein
MEFQTMMIGVGIIFIVLLGAIGGFMIYYNKMYKYRIRLFYQLSGEEQYHEGKTYKARKVFLSKGGVQRLWVPKLKEYVSYFGKKMGENKYYYAEGPDGYLYNIVLGDLDTARGVLDIEPIDRDLRDFYITNQRNINERYQKPKNWPMILQSVTIVFIVILMFAGGYVIFDQMKVAGEQVSKNLESTIAVTELQKELISKIYKLVGEVDGGGPGIIAVP